VIGVEGKGGHDLEADGTGPEFVEHLLAPPYEGQALPDMPFRNAEADGDGLDRLAGIERSAMATNSSAGCIAARIAFSISEVSSAATPEEKTVRSGWGPGVRGDCSSTLSIENASTRELTSKDSAASFLSDAAPPCGVHRY
jgi:hypothetical protein